PGTAADALHGSVVIDRQMDEVQTRNRIAQQIAIAAFERGTGEHETDAVFDGSLHLGDELAQPLDTVGIGQRRAGTHAGNIFFGMEMIGFDMTIAKRIGKRVTGVGLAGTTDTHDHQRTAGTGESTVEAGIHWSLSSSIEVLR